MMLLDLIGMQICRAKLCLVSVFPDIVEDCPKIRNLPTIFVRSLENVGPGVEAINTYFCVTLDAIK